MTIILVSHERWKRDREEADPQWLLRANRRGVVDTLAKVRSYWTVMWWLSARANHPRKAALPKFFSLDEAIAYFRPIRGRTPELRCAYVVAKHFRRQGPGAWQ